MGSLGLEYDPITGEWYIPEDIIPSETTTVTSTPIQTAQPASQETIDKYNSLATMPVATYPAQWNYATPFVSQSATPANPVVTSMPQTAIPWTDIFLGWYGGDSSVDKFNQANIWENLKPTTSSTKAK